MPEEETGWGVEEGSCVLCPKSTGKTWEVYVGKSQNSLFIIRSWCGLQCAEWIEESKFPCSEQCAKADE